MSAVYSFPSKGSLSSNLASLVVSLSRDAISEHGIFTLALSGGSLPDLFSNHLISLPPSEQPDYSKWHVFLADERIVPLNHPDSNYGLCKKELFDKVNIPLAQTYPIAYDETSSPETIAIDYQEKLTSILAKNHNGVPVFDAVFLGMGPDGHTCSLFPNHPLLAVTDSFVTYILDSPKPPPKRVTLTFPVVNTAKNIIFVVTGESKSEPIKSILEGNGLNAQGQVYPSGMVKPRTTTSKLIWFLDTDAASKLQVTSTLSSFIL